MEGVESAGRVGGRAVGSKLYKKNKTAGISTVVTSSLHVRSYLD